MEINFTEIAAAGMILFAVIDIIGSIPLIVEIKRKAGELHPVKATAVSFVIMIAFLFLGVKLINLIGIDVNSFAVAGSFVLFFLALEMILGIQLFKEDEHTPKSTASIVPLAFPIIAGAGSMTTIISLKAEYESVNIAIAILLNMVLVFAVLKSTNKIEKILGPGGIAILRKVFGIVLLAIAVKLFTSNAIPLIFPQAQ
ncbi:MAG: MarC family protein [Bacteroidetes bacterium]|nr:MAG: MarC family protein [Bacteroidota bacterium]